VRRNRLRRVLREQLRTLLLQRFGSLDVVVRALPGAYATVEADLRSELMTLSALLSGDTR
jgi:ribonuclease P protein component